MVVQSDFSIVRRELCITDFRCNLLLSVCTGHEFIEHGLFVELLASYFLSYLRVASLKVVSLFRVTIVYIGG